MPKAKKEPPSFYIKFNALTMPIFDQLKAQGIAIDGKISKSLDKAAEATVILSIHGFLTDAETQKARQRIMKSITKEVANAQG